MQADSLVGLVETWVGNTSGQVEESIVLGAASGALLKVVTGVAVIGADGAGVCHVVVVVARGAGGQAECG